jgi:uncharacterized protein (DUF4415 family)
MTISRQRQLEILRKMKEEEIDCSDAPPATLTELREAVAFIPPEKRPITIRLDEDVLEWFKAQQPKGYQTLINAVLREYARAKSGSNKDRSVR